MSNAAFSPEIGSSAKHFARGMDGAAIAEATAGLDARQLVVFWSTFRSMVDIPFPGAVTGRAIDDIAAVISGSKPAAIFHPSQLESNRAEAEELFSYLGEEGDRDSPLVIDGFSGAEVDLVFLGQADSVATLVEQYEACGGENPSRPVDAAFDRDVGRVLGYNAAAIEYYIARQRYVADQ